MENDKAEWILILGQSSDIVLNLLRSAQDLDNKLSEAYFMPLKNSYGDLLYFSDDMNALLLSVSLSQFNRKINLLIISCSRLIYLCNAIDERIFVVKSVKDLGLSLRSYLVSLQEKLKLISE